MDTDTTITFEEKVDESGKTRLYAVISGEKCDDSDKKIIVPLPRTQTWWPLWSLSVAAMILQKKDERTDNEGVGGEF